MATWTQTDIDTLKAAIRAGILEVRFDGPPARKIVYQDLGAMRALLAEMTASVAGSSRKAYRLASHSKGF